MQSDVELNCKTALTELRGLLSGRTEQFGQFLIQKSKEWNFTIKELLGAFEQLSAEFSKDNKINKDVFQKVRKYLLNPVVKESLTTEKILAPEEANKLVSIIAKYIDLDMVGELTGNEFGYGLFSKMEESEIVAISRILDIDITANPLDFIDQCVKSMIKNNLLGLLASYKQTGLDK